MSTVTSAEQLDQLIEAGAFPDAIRLLAQHLPKRQAVWWACLCARAAVGANPADPIVAALGAAEAWVADPSEENRRAAMPAAEAVGYGTAAGCAAAAAFWSGGSLAPPNVPPVPPGEHLTAHGAASAVMLAAVAREPEKAPEKSRAFLRLGREIAEGAHPWPEPARTVPPVEPERKQPEIDTPGSPPRTTTKAARPTLNWD
jgi:hypothetical protein